MDPRIADYIRENRRRYTREALTRQLMSAGHDPGEIERTWAALDTPDADDVSGEGFWGRFALILVGINVGVFLLVGLMTGMLQSAAGGGIALLVILGVALVIGALIAWGLVAATGPTRLSRTTALVIGAAIPALFALLIGGACYALVGSLGGISGPSDMRPGQLEVDLGEPLNLRQSGFATCEPRGADQDAGLSLFGTVEFVDVQRGAGDRVDATLSLMTRIGEDDRFLSWGTDMGPAPSGIDASLVGLDGMVSFTDLPAGQDDPGGNLGDPLSGEISWTCQ